MSTGSDDFVVAVSGAAGSVEDWKRTLDAESSGAAVVSPAVQAEERLRQRGRKLGERVQDILAGLGNEYQLLAVIWEGFRSRWLIRIQAPRGISEVPVPAELGDGAAETGGIDDLDRLKNLVLFGAGRPELIFRNNFRHNS